MNIFVVSVFAVAMIGLMIPSSFGTNTVTSSSLQFQFNIPDEWIEENSYIHLWKLYNSQDRTLERFPAVKISSPDNKILMYVTEDVTYNVKSIGEMDNFCHNMLEGEIYCDSLTKIEEKCVETINGCYQVTKFPYKTSDSPQVKTLKVAYWYKIGEGTPKGEDNCAQTRGCFTNVFFVYDSELEKSGSFNHKSIMSKFQIDDQKPEFGSVMDDNLVESSSKSNSEIVKIMSSKIIQGEPYNLLVIEVQINEDEWGHGPNLSGMESGFNINERDTKIFTDDFTFFGTTIPKNTLWDENCPIYVVKKAYPDMPIYFTLCFEIPKSESNFILKHTSPAWQGKLEFSVESQSSVSIPTWIKNNAGWWAEGQIDDNSFVQGIQFMIKENIFSIPNLPESSETAESVPAWVKNNAGWWAEGQIDDNSFVKGIEYLVKVGIIQVS